MKKSKVLMIFVIVFTLAVVVGIPAYGATLDLDLMSLVPTELLIIAVVVYCIGIFLKSSKKVPNWLIPIILLVVAIFITISYMAVSLGEGFTLKVIIDGFIYGILLASVAVYCNQVLKQITTGRLKE